MLHLLLIILVMLLAIWNIAAGIAASVLLIALIVWASVPRSYRRRK